MFRFVFLISAFLFSASANAANYLAVDCLKGYSSLLKPIQLSNIPSPQSALFSKLNQPQQYLGKLPSQCLSELGVGDVKIISTSQGLYSIDIKLVNTKPVLIRYIQYPEGLQVQASLDRNKAAAAYFESAMKLNFSYQVYLDGNKFYVESLSYRGKEALLYE